MNGLTANSATRVSEITSSIASLEGAKEKLAGRIIDMINRLQPVIREPGPPSPAGIDCGKDVGTCRSTKLGAAMWSVEDGLNELSDRIEDVLSRVEL